MVSSPDGSEPASASVSPNDAVTSPEASRGSQLARWSSVPPSSSTCPAIPLFVPNRDRSVGVVQPSSNASWTSSVSVMPSPPYFSGMAKP